MKSQKKVLIDNNTFAQECLDAHNQYRKKHAVPPMSLNKKVSIFEFQCEYCSVISIQYIKSAHYDIILCHLCVSISKYDYVFVCTILKPIICSSFHACVIRP